MTQFYHGSIGIAPVSANKFNPVTPPSPKKEGGILVSGYKLHPALSELQAPAYGFWAYLRGLDLCGSGCAIVSLEDVALTFSVHPNTVYKWLKQGLGTWFWRWTNLGANQIRVHYRSIVRIHAELKIQPAECAIVPSPKYLTRSGRKAGVAEIKTIVTHKQAIHAAKKSSNRRERNLIDGSEYLRSNSSVSSLGDSKNRRYFVLKSDSPNCPHGSIRTMARSVSRAPSTIQNRLSTKFRIKAGLPRLDKIRVVRQLSQTQSQNYRENQRRSEHEAAHPCSKGSQFFVNPLSNSFQFVKEVGDRLFFLGGNIYDSVLEVRRNRWEKTRIKRGGELVGG
jgi:hypothetical protein